MLLRLTGYVFVYFLGAATVIFVPNFREKVVVLFKESSKKAIKLFETAGDATVEAISKLAIEGSGDSGEGTKSVDAPKKEEVKPESPSTEEKSKSVAVKKEAEAKQESPSAEENSVADKKEEENTESTEDKAKEAAAESTEKDNKS